MEPSAHQITRLLQAWSEGEQSALERLIPLVYEELHRLAHHYMAGERPGHTLQTTALLNEAYLRLVDSAKPSWQNRAHFFAVSAQVMRDWKFAKSWLRRELSKEKPVGA
ncbi:MAG TPA: ECF-type sigma factor [Terriglobia bacterium]|nr:ECF-type sigma factor [Terriglobia bacterium]